MNWEQIELFEQWMPVVGYETLYEVSDWGRVRRLADTNRARAGHLINPHKSKQGYLMLGLYKDGKRQGFTVHSLVAAAFLGPRPLDKQVDHIDGDKTHNSIRNLRYVSSKENVSALDARLGKWRKGNPDLVAPIKITDKEVAEIRRLSLEGMSGPKIAKLFGIGHSTVYRIIHYQSRKEG